MPTTPDCPSINPNLKNIKTLKTFKVVGTKTPENVPSFSAPPAGLEIEPGFSSLDGASPSALLEILCICAVSAFAQSEKYPLA